MSSTHLWVAYVLGAAVLLAAFTTAWALGRIYRHLGLPAWYAWLPGLNLWMFLRRGNIPGALVLLPLLGIWLGPEFTAIMLVTEAILFVTAAGSIARSLNAPPSWTVLFILSPWLWALGLRFALDNPDLSREAEHDEAAYSPSLARNQPSDPEYIPDEVFFDPDDPDDDFDLNAYLPAGPADPGRSRYT